MTTWAARAASIGTGTQDGLQQLLLRKPVRFRVRAWAGIIGYPEFGDSVALLPSLSPGWHAMSHGSQGSCVTALSRTIRVCLRCCRRT
jgi:hypothetical protein